MAALSILKQGLNLENDGKQKRVVPSLVKIGALEA